MSASNELIRIIDARNVFRQKGIELKISSGTEKIDELANDFESIVNRGSITAQIREGETYTIPKGFHDGTGTVSGVSGGGSYNLQSKNIIPTKKSQQITPDPGYYGLSDVTVQAIPNQFQDVSSVTATQSDVLADKIFVLQDGSSVHGTMQNNGAINKTLDSKTTTFNIPSGYHNGSGNINIVLEEKNITPTKEKQTIIPDDGKVMSRVDIEPIPNEYIDTSDGNATSEDILVDKKAYVNGILITGSIPNNNEIAGSIDGISNFSFVIPAGYTSGGTIYLTDDILNILKQI